MSRNPQAQTSSGKLKVTITVDRDQVLKVDEIADRRRTSRGSIVRQAIDFYLAENRDGLHMEDIHTSNGKAA